MIIGLIIEISVGLIFLFLARSVSNGNSRLIHDYHTKNVKENDKKNYCKLFGKGLYVIGIFIFVSSIFTYKENSLGVLLSIFIGIFVGIIMITKAQMKYNGGWFL